MPPWILEKWRGWADSAGDLDATFSRDFLLTIVTLYWVTQTITILDAGLRGQSMAGRGAAVRSTSSPCRLRVAVFANQFIDDGSPPREWAERLYDIRRWTPMPRGGHFPSAEEPELLSRDIAAFFDGIAAR